MEELGWFNHHQQEIEESIMFGTQNNIFLNPIQDVGSTIYSSPEAAPSSFGSATQYWRQTLAVNSLHEGKNVIPLTITESNAYTSPDHEDDISVIFSTYKNLCNKIIKNNSDVAKLTDDVIDSSGFYEDSPPRSKRPRLDPVQSTSSTINFRRARESDETNSNVILQMKEMVYRAAAFRPVSFSDEEVVERPRRKNVGISSDPQTVAARGRRERVSERIRVSQKLVPGGNQMDTASMLDEAANYLKFLRSHVKAFEQFGENFDCVSCGTSTNAQRATQNIIHNVTLGIPFPMQTLFLPSYPQIYPSPPPA